jgi:hypothetical protein
LQSGGKFQLSRMRLTMASMGEGCSVMFVSRRRRDPGRLGETGRESLDRSVDGYNAFSDPRSKALTPRRRPHSTLGRRTPDEAYFDPTPFQAAA